MIPITAGAVGPRLLLAGRDAPGWGGASTINYVLFEQLQRDGFDVHYVNLVVESDRSRLAGFFGSTLGNPKSLPDVHTCILRTPEWRSDDNLTALIDQLAPNCLVGFGYMPAWLLEQAASRLPVVFLTSGCAGTKRLLQRGTIEDFQDFTRKVHNGVPFPISPHDPEAHIIERATLICVHSPTVRFAFEHLYPAQAGKIHARDISIADLVAAEAGDFQVLRQPFEQRDIDLLFVANEWQRPEKNYPLVQALCRRFPHHRIDVVGICPTVEPNAVHHGLVTARRGVYGLLGRARTVACPSLLDAAPGVLFEAAAMGCNVVTSPNCGNWEICARPLLAPSCHPDEFAAAIERSWTTECPSPDAAFRGGYAELSRILATAR
jgi:glycosyltransferase involved in cell wall biosynthesis